MALPCSGPLRACPRASDRARARRAIAGCQGAMIATIIANLMGDRNVWSATIFGFCNAGEALLTAWLVEHYFGSPFSVDMLTSARLVFCSSAMACNMFGRPQRV